MTTFRTIRVVIVDEHEMVVTSLKIMFESLSGIEIIGRAVNGAEAVDLAGALLPDVMLMDIMMPVMDGLTATRLIRKQYPQVKIVILTASTLEADKQAALDAGAHSYVRKEGSSVELIEAIRAVMRND
ncbi:MAG: response regulator transcription factor [Chloroflexota bacterium]